MVLTSSFLAPKFQTNLFYDIQSKENTKTFRKQFTVTATKIGYSAQFGIFADINGSRQSESLLIYLLLSVGK